MSTSKLPSGFLEYTPKEQIVFNNIIRTIESEYEHAGFSPLETVSIGYSSVLLAKAGGELDKEIYRFQKGDRDLSLRFDLTVPMARYIAEHHRNIPMPTKIYQIGKSWRAEKPQKGRYRELYQADIDVLGSDSRLAEAEMLSVIQNIIYMLDLPAITFRVSNRKILEGLLAYYNVGDVSGVLRVVDKREKMSQVEWVDSLRRLELDKDTVAALVLLMEEGRDNESILRLLHAHSCDNKTFREGVSELQELTQYMILFKVEQYRIDLSIVRGQDYYTGTVFESNLEGLESYGSICSGGRYDNLVSHYIDTPISGFGASIGVSRLFGILKEEEWMKAQEKSLVNIGVFCVNELSMEDNITSIVALRDTQGVAFELYPDITTFKKALQYANRKGYEYVLILGADEAKMGEILVKNMKSGEQKIIPIQDFQG